MADQGLVANSVFAGWTPIEGPRISALPREGLTLASFAAAKGRADELSAVMDETYGLKLPKGPARVEGRGIAVVWMGPDQWLAVADGGSGRDLERELRPLVGGLASVVDQSDSRGIVRVSGPAARDVLAKGLPIDLHPRVFQPGSAAITHASHIGVLVWQIDEQPTYELAMFRSFALSFVHWLEDTAQEYRSLPG